jgi:hypothetical protein
MRLSTYHRPTAYCAFPAGSWQFLLSSTTYLLQHDIDEIWGMPEWENLKGCHD